VTPRPERIVDRSDFRSKSTLGVAISALVLLIPFSVNNFLQGRYVLGIGSAVVVAMLAANAWSVTRGRYHPSLVLFGLVPIILLFLVLSLRQQGIVGALWCYPAVLAFHSMLPERKAWVANAALLAVCLPQTWLVLEAPLAARVTVTLIGVSVFSVIFVRVITDQQRRLEDQAVTDPLTGLANRVLLRDSLEHAIQQSNRTGVPMTLISLDLDHFKSINDTLGHDAGDRVLRSVGEVLRRRIRRADRAFRLGGEEFLALLYGADQESGQQVAEDLRGAIASLAPIPERAVTASVGIATLRPDEGWREWMKRSDENLYRAKSGGRDRVVA